MKEQLKEMLICEENLSHMKETEKNSFNVSKLLGTKVTQSQSIRFGHIFQSSVKKWITALGGEVSDEHFVDCYKTGNDTNKGKKDVDILFKFNNKLYYFEAKVNMDLDSEKSKATNKKILDIAEHLRETQNLDVVSGVLTCWFKKETGLPIKVDNVYFVSDLFKILNYDISEKEYYEMLL